MGLRFHANERIQQGRGIGGLFRGLIRGLSSAIPSLFRSAGKVASGVGRTALKAAKSKTGQMILDKAKEQAMESTLNLATDALRGNDLQESFSREVDSSKLKAADVLDKLKKRKQDEKEMEGSGISSKKMRLKLKEREKKGKNKKVVLKNKRKTNKYKSIFS